MRKHLGALALPLLLAPLTVHAFGPKPAASQHAATAVAGAPIRSVYVPLGNRATGIMFEPVKLDPNKSHIAVIVVHPGHGSMTNAFITRALPRYGYRVLAITYNGPDNTYYDLLTPLAAGIKALRAIQGIDKVVLSGNSTGGAEITAYEDVAENGPAACQRPERIYKCTTQQASNLPKADGMLLVDGNSGAPERLTDLNPAVDPHNSHSYNPALDLFSAQNGYNPTTGGANYDPEFLKTFFAAQAAAGNKLIDEAQTRLAIIEKGEGEYKQDEPFVVERRGVFSSEVKPEFAYIGLLSQTHAPHMLLKADGTRPVQIVSLTKRSEKEMRPANTPHTYGIPEMETVRSYLSGSALRLTSDYRWTKDNVYGVEWHSSPASAPGSAEGIHAPTLVLAGTCAEHIVWLEITYDRLAAKDKEYVAVDGADHEFAPCKPEYGETFKHAMDYVDNWLSRPGRL